jgi:hypothetical protein
VNFKSILGLSRTNKYVHQLVNINIYVYLDARCNDKEQIAVYSESHVKHVSEVFGHSEDSLLSLSPVSKITTIF